MARFLVFLTCTLSLLALDAYAGQTPTAGTDPHGDSLPAGAIARCGMLPRWRHDAVVGFAAFLADGKSVVCASHDGAVRVWEFPSGKEIRRIAASPQAVTGLQAAALTPDGKTIATAFAFVSDEAVEQEIRVHDIATGKELACLKTDAAAVLDLAFSPQGTQLTAQHRDGVLHTWKWTEAKEVSQVGNNPKAKTKGGKAKGGFGDPVGPTGGRKGEQFVYSPDGKTLLVFGQSTTPRFVDVASGQEVAAGGSAGPMTSVWFSDDAKFLFTQESGGAIHKWDAVSGKDGGVAVAGGAPPGSYRLVSPDGRVAVEWPTGSAKKKGGALDPNNPFGPGGPGGFGGKGGKGKKGGGADGGPGGGVIPGGPGGGFAPGAGALNQGKDGKGGGVLADPDKLFDMLANGKDVVVIADGGLLKRSMEQFAADTGNKTGQLTREQFRGFVQQLQNQMGQPNFGGGGKGPATPKPLTEDELDQLATERFKRADVNGDGRLTEDEMSEKLKAVWKKYDKNGDGAIDLEEYKAFFRDINRAAATLELVAPDDATGKLADVLAGLPPSYVLFSPDSKILAVKSADETHIDLYETVKGQLLRTLPIPKEAAGSATAAAYLALPTMLFSPDGKVLTFQRNVNATTMVLFDVARGREIGQVPLKVAEEPAPAVKGKTTTKGKAAATQRSPLLGAFSPDARCIAVLQAPGVLVVYELASGQPRLTFREKLAGAPPGCGPVVAFSPDGRLLACAGGGDGTVHLLNVATGKELAAFTGHRDLVTAVAFSPDGKRVASASADTTALVWDITKVQRPAPAAKTLQPADLDRCWQALATNDAAQAHDAIGQLVASPKEAVASIKDRVKPASGATLKQIEELVFQLDDNQYKVRYKATSELLQIGEQILPILDKALLAAPPPEMKKRLEELRGLVTVGLPLQGERLRVYRAVEVLERVGTPEARQVLQALADGAPGALATTSAQAALKR